MDLAACERTTAVIAGLEVAPGLPASRLAVLSMT